MNCFNLNNGSQAEKMQVPLIRAAIDLSCKVYVIDKNKEAPEVLSIVAIPIKLAPIIKKKSYN